MKEHKLIICAVFLALTQTFLLCGCAFRSETAADGTKNADYTENADNTEDAETLDAVSIGSRTFQSSEITENINAVYANAVYYGYNIFDTYTSTLYDWLRDGGALTYDLYAVSSALSGTPSERLFLVDIDGDAQPEECGLKNLTMFHLLVLTENRIQSQKRTAVFCKKDELDSTGYNGLKASADLIGTYEIRYTGKPFDGYYEPKSDELEGKLKASIQNGFERDAGTYADMPSGRYTVILAPAFTGDSDAYIYFRYENGGSLFGAYCSNYKYYNENGKAFISYIEHLDDATHPYYVGENVLRLEDSPCTFEIVKP